MSRFGPCEPFATPDDVCNQLPDDTRPQDILPFLDQATELIWKLTGRQFGACMKTVRPYRENCGKSKCCNPSPRLINGQFYNCDPGTCGDIDFLELPCVSVCEILYIVVDGGLLDLSQVMLNKNKLVRCDGGSWPVCSDPCCPYDFEIAYRCGIPVPSPLVAATANLAIEFFYACYRPDKCRLPKEPVTNGLTGCPEIDMILACYPPPKRPTVCFNPDSCNTKFLEVTEPCYQEYPPLDACHG